MKDRLRIGIPFMKKIEQEIFFDNPAQSCGVYLVNEIVTWEASNSRDKSVNILPEDQAVSVHIHQS